MPLSLLRQFFFLILFRIGPQDLPASHAALYVAAGLYALVSFLIVSSVDVGIETGAHPLTEVLIELGLLTAFIALWVWIREVPNRFTQTVTAAFGVNAMINLVAWPLLVASPPVEEVGSVQAGPLEFLILAVMMWNLMALGHVFRHAFNVPLPIGFLLAFVYFVLAGFVVTFLL